MASPEAYNSMCGTAQWRLDLRSSRFLWETPSERAATLLHILLVPVVAFTWAPGVAWDVPIESCGGWARAAKRFTRLVVTTLYACVHLLYVLVPWEVSASNGATVANLVFTALAVLGSALSCIPYKDVHAHGRLATSEDPSVSTPSNGLWSAVRSAIDVLNVDPTGTEEGARISLSFLSCMCFCAALGADVYVRDTPLTHGLGYTAISILSVYFCVFTLNHTGRSRPVAAAHAADTDEGEATTTSSRCGACVPVLVGRALVACGLVVALLAPVLVLRPCASYD